jgi:hypothetical protein
MDFHATMPEDGATSSFVLSLEHLLNARQVLEASDDVDRNREEGPDVSRRAEGVHQRDSYSSQFKAGQQTADQKGNAVRLMCVRIADRVASSDRTRVIVTRAILRDGTHG